eukprot:scaffold26096_cov31-Tisochrysis_lutea.AAC.4
MNPGAQAAGHDGLFAAAVAARTTSCLARRGTHGTAPAARQPTLALLPCALSPLLQSRWADR